MQSVTKKISLSISILFFCFYINSQTSLLPGDLVILGVNANDFACGSSNGLDYFSFAAFKDIEPGTVLDITDNGWERMNANQFGNSEGFLRLTFNIGIPAGQVITLVSHTFPDSYSCLSHPGAFNTTLIGNGMNMSNAGDQAFICQGGNWNPGTGTSTHDASYSGSVLFGFSTQSVWNANGTSQQSNLHPDVIPCYHMQPSASQSNYMKYTGSLAPATQLEWITRIKNQANWTEYPDCTAYNTSPPIWHTPITLPINPSNLSVACSTCSGCSLPINDVLTFTLPNAGGPFNIEYTDGVNIFNLNGAFNNTPSATVNVNVNENTTYSITSVTDADGCPIYSNFLGDAEITVSAAPVITNPGTLSNCNSVTLPDISGNNLTGNELYYPFPNGGGTPLNEGQTVFTSGTYYIFDPANNCSQEVNFQIDITDAPQLVLAQVNPTVCPGTSIDLSALNIIDGNNTGATITFHASNPPSPGNQLSTNYTPAGSQTIFAYAQINAACESVLPISINVSTAPTAVISGTNTICANESTDITFNFTGNGPFTYQYAINGVPVNPTTTVNSNSDVISVTPTSNTTYTLISVVGGTCDGNEFGNAMITVQAAPSSNDAQLNVCENPNGLTVFDLTDATNTINGGNGEDVTFYLDAATAVNIPDVTASNFGINNPTTIYAIVGTGACQSAVAEIDLIFTPGPDLVLNGASPDICLGDEIILSDLLVVDNNAAGGVITFHSAQPETPANQLPDNYIPLGDETIYAYSEVSPTCFDDLEISVETHTLSTAEISGETSICEGEDAILTFTFTGVPPFTFQYTENGIPINPSITTNLFTTSVVVNPTVTTNYFIDNITGGNNCDVVLLGDFITVTVAPTATATISGDQTICAGETADLTVTFNDGSAPFDFSLITNGIGAPQPFTVNENPYTFSVTPFFNSVYTLGTASTEGCGTVVAGSADVMIAPAPNAEISGGETICEGDIATLTFTFTGDAPYTFVYNEGALAQAPITTSLNPFTLDVNPTSTTNYSLHSFQNNVCPGTISGSALVTLIESTTATLSTDGTVCAGGDYDLMIDFEGAAPFAFVYTVNGLLQTETTTSTDPYILTVSPSATTTYGLFSVTGNGCPGTIEGTAEVNVSDIPTFTILSTNCDLNTFNYTVQFEIMGGTSPYTVSGGGDLVGNIFTSNEIASNTPYTFLIDDSNGCGPITVSGSENCACFNNPGTMNIPVEPLEFCFGETAIAIHNGDEISEPFIDTFQFVLHTNPDASLGTIIALNTVPEFTQDGTIDLNTIYYISPISGNDDGNGNVDLTDPCFLIGAGVPVIWYPDPTATISSAGNVCAGGDAAINFAFEGTAPFEFGYTINNGATITVNTSDNPFVLTQNITEQTTYELVSVMDANCADLNLMETVIVNISPEISVVNENYICAENVSMFQYTFEVIGQEPFQVIGTGGVFIDNVFTSIDILNGEFYYFEITDANACNTIIIEGVHVCEYVCETELGTMSNAPLELCVGEIATAIYDNTSEDIEIGDLFQYVIHTSPSTNLGTVLATSNTPIFAWDENLYLPNTTYYISAISGDEDGNGNVDLMDPCLEVTEGQLVLWNQPNINFISTDTTLCEAGCLDLTVALNGVPDFTFEISDNQGNVDSHTTFLDEYSFTVCPTETTTYSITSISSNTCVGGVLFPEFVNVEILVPISSQNYSYECSIDNMGYIATLEIEGGMPPYTLVSGNGSLNLGLLTTNTLNNNTPYTFHIQDDLGCGPFEIIISENCACQNDAGALDLMTIYSCGETDPITAIVTIPPTLEMGVDILEYILHDGTSTVIGNILDTQTEPTFLPPTDYIVGQIYYISAIIGADNGMGNVDITSSCFDFTIGVPVVFYNLPQVIMPEDLTICEGNCVDIFINILEEEEAILNLSINGTISNYNITNNTLIVNICPEDYGILGGQSMDIFPSQISNPACFLDYNNPPTTTLTVSSEAISNLNETLCIGDSIVIENQVFNFNTPTGEVIIPLGSNLGCDSTISVNLIFYPVTEGVFNGTLCPGGSITIGDLTLDEFTTSGIATIENGSSNGCDSLVNASIVFENEVFFNLDTIVCAGTVVIINDLTLDEITPTGSTTFPLGSYLGCDSTINVSVSFIESIDFEIAGVFCEDYEIEVGDEVFNINNPMGEVTFEGGSVQGCDSIVTVDLMFYASIEENISYGICPDVEVEVGGEMFDADNLTGTITLENASSNGCDSTLNINLFILENAIMNLDTTMCPGESFDFLGVTFDQATPNGQFILANQAANSCDSIININSTFLPESIEYITETLGPGEFLEIEGVTFDQTNLDGEILLPSGSFNGCDSTIVVSINFELITETSAEAPICFGESNGSISIDDINGGFFPIQVSIDNVSHGVLTSFPYTITGLTSGQYQVKLTDDLGGVASINVEVPQQEELTLELGENHLVDLGEDAELFGQTNMDKIETLTWEPTTYLDNDTTLLVEVIQPLQTTNYSLFLRDSSGCTLRDFVTVFVRKDQKVFIPNVFSPDNNGQNDEFVIFAGNQVVNIQSLQIYDRWGNQVFAEENFQPNDSSMGWDGFHRGVLMNSQVLVYVAVIEFIDGNVEVFKGDFSLMR